MLPIILAIVEVGAVAGLGVAVGAVTVGSALIAVATTALSAGISYFTQPSAGRAQTAAPVASAAVTQEISAPGNQQRSVSIAQAIPPRRFAYGNFRQAGVLFFENNANPNLVIGIAMSDGVIEAIDSVYFGDALIPVDGTGAATTATIYSGKFTRHYDVGLSTQAADTLLTANFGSLTSDFRQQGVARLVCQLNWGVDATEHNSLWGDSIQPSAQGRWLHCYDPRDGTQVLATPSTWKYTDNPVLHVAHALTNAWLVGIPNAAIDYTTVVTAANVCDATLVYNGNTVPYFRGAGIFQADADFGSQILDMLSAFRGKITYVAGKYGIIADAARSSVWTVTEDDLIELGEFTSAAEAGAAFSSVSAKYFDVTDAGGQMTTTPVYKLSAVISAEGDRRLVPTLPFTPDSHSAQILGYRELLQSRDGRTVQLTLSDAALYLVPSDVITLSFQSAGFMSGDWEVLQIDLSQVGAVVSLRGYNPTCYTDPTTYIQ